MSHGDLNTDVFVVGGGPAGLAMAIAAQMRGLSVVVADLGKPPIDKACGEGLMPQTVAALKGFGVTLGPGQTVPFRGIRFIGEGKVATGEFSDHYGLGIRRTRLHASLNSRLAVLGGRTLWETRVTKIRRGEVELESGTVKCRWVVGADGQNSLVRRSVGLDRGRPEETRFGFRQHFRIAPWSDFVDVHWGRACQVVVTPVAPEEVCVVVTSRSPQIRMQQAFAEFPELAQRLNGCEPVTKNLGAVSALRVLRKVSRGPFALIGDASGSVDSLTGEGLGLAFHQANALADAMAHDNLQGYESAHRSINRPSEIMSRLLLAMEGRAWLRRRVIGTLALEPHLFGRLLAVHDGTFSPLSFGFGNACKLGLRLLAIPS